MHLRSIHFIVKKTENSEEKKSDIIDQTPLNYFLLSTNLNDEHFIITAHHLQLENKD